MHTCIHAYMHTCIHAYMYTCIHAYMYTCIHGYMHTCIHAYMDTCILTCTHERIHTYLPHTYILTEPITYMHTSSSSSCVRIISSLPNKGFTSLCLAAWTSGSATSIPHCNNDSRPGQWWPTIWSGQLQASLSWGHHMIHRQHIYRLVLHIHEAR